MDAPANKRPLTEEVRQSASFSDQFSRASSWGTPEELVLRVRGAAARGRKSVLEGYKTTPTLTKAQSTGGLIFKSMNETLADVYSNVSAPANAENNKSIFRKRPRSETDQGGQGSTQEDYNMDTHYDQLGNAPPIPPAADLPSSRLVRPLRASRRALRETHSMPVGVLESKSRSGDNGNPSETNHEEDWSQETSFKPSEQPFEPMVLE